MSDKTENIELLLSEFLDGPSLELCVILWSISQIWDDLYDGDDRNPEDVNKVFTDAMVNMQMNPFYQQHFHHLTAMIDNVILKWKDANILEKSGDEHNILLAWGHRAGIYDMFCYIHKLAKGDSNEASAERLKIRQMYGELYEDFLKEMTEWQTQ